MKKYSPAFLISAVALIVFFSCTKINEATTLGGDLIPPVDNVNTFEMSLLPEVTDSRNSFLVDDSVRVGYGDPVALGEFNDPEFGNVHANFAFSLSSPVPAGFYPFVSKLDSLGRVDSVVLSLAYDGAYGDTNSVQSITVEELPQSTTFRSDTSYLYRDPASDFTGTVVGSKTYTIRNLRDTVIAKEPGNTDTTKTKYVNVIRIKLNNNALGNRLIAFDTAIGKPNPGFYNDSAFKKLFPGLAVRTSSGGNALTYFNLADQSKTRLIVYYTYQYGPQSRDTSVAVSFTHRLFGQSNYVRVQPGGNWAASIDQPNPQKLYVMSSPSRAYTSMYFRGLDTMTNKVIHRAELIAEVIPSTGDQTFTAPSMLFLDRSNKWTPDTAIIFPLDLPTSFTDGSVNFGVFGGNLKNNSYRFNITRHVQGIITRKDRNDSLRLYAPLRTIIFNPSYVTAGTPSGTYQVVTPGDRVMEGRVVLAGPAYTNPAQRLRLRIIYSNL